MEDISIHERNTSFPQQGKPQKQQEIKLKICGMKTNPAQVAALGPDYLGFIFWEGSPRHFDGEIPLLAPGIRKVGVFVDAPIEEIKETVKKHSLAAVQLHGNEGVPYCKDLKNGLSVISGLGKNTPGTVVSKDKRVQIIKVFSIKDNFDFSVLKAYEQVCDYFLFDTKGKLPGGNGYAFDWTVLKNYPSKKSYFLSGGIGLANTTDIREFLGRPESKYCHALDVNSQFEDKPGSKNIEKLKEFKSILWEKTT